jgi:hypothetical protein
LLTPETFLTTKKNNEKDSHRRDGGHSPHSRDDGNNYFNGHFKSILMYSETEEKTKGNPIASNRFRWQTYTKDTDEPMDSEWSQFKGEAIKQGARYLVKQFAKFGKDDMVVKVFNEMNYKSKPTVIILDEAYKILR